MKIIIIYGFFFESLLNISISYCQVIAKETARQLNMGTKIFDRDKLGLHEGHAVRSELADYIEEADGYIHIIFI